MTQTDDVSKSSCCMAFHHEDGMIPSWNHAFRFAGEKGRIATLPDIILARMFHDSKSFVWNYYFTTLSAEYFGIGSDGRKKIIVAHGIGPMSTLEGIKKAYSHEFKDKTRRKNGGRITQKEFLALERGYYGEVKVVDFEDYKKLYQYPFLQILTLSQALCDPLLRARLGIHSEIYLEDVKEMSKQWHIERCGAEYENKYGLANHEKYVERVKNQHMINILFPNQSSIIKVGGASNCPYEFIKIEEGFAVGHLLTITGLVHCCHDGKESLVHDIDCCEWSDNVRFLALKEDSDIKNINPGILYLPHIVKKNWKKLLVPCIQKNIGFRALVEFPDGTLFTQYPKKGSRMDTYEGEFNIIEYEKIGEPVSFKTTIGGYHGFFKYGISEVKAIAPPQTNAYQVCGEVEIIYEEGNPAYHQVDIQFCKVKVDSSQRLLKSDEIKNDFDKLMSLVE